MIQDQLTSILTTVGLNLLAKLTDNSRSVVISPSEVALSVAKSTLKHCEPLPYELFKSDYESEFRELIEQLENFEAMKVNPSPPVWNFAISEFKKKNFKLSNGKLKKMNFIWMNLETNMELSCEKTGAQMAQDKEFKVLSIPLAGDAGKFVVFLPENQEETIEESLKKLNTRKFQRLIDDLVPKFIHFELPVFKIQSKFFISENLTMSDRGLTHEKEFEVCLGENNDFRRGLLMDRCEYVPYIFRVNRPFIFCVVQNGVPVTMGIFDGN